MTARRRIALRATLAVAVLLGCAGCSSLKTMFGSGTDAAPAARAASAPTGIAGERAAYRIDVQAPGAEQRLLIEFLDLSRFQNAPEAESITVAELDRLVAVAPAQARALLETDGYFNAKVTVTKIDEPDNRIPLLRIAVDPGPRARVDRADIEVSGELKTAADAGDADARSTLDALRADWPLQANERFTQSAWSAAKTSSMARVRARGYPAAAWVDTRARVDADADRVALALQADSGPLYRLGPVRVEGLQRYDESAVRNLAEFGPGTPYSEKALLDYQERLQKLGLFEGAVVEIDADPASAKAAPVIVHVKEQRQQQLTLGAGVSADTGPRLSVEHQNRRLFDRPFTLKDKLELGPQRQYAEGEIDSYPLEDAWRNLLAGNVERLKTDDEWRTSVEARIGRSQDREHLLRLYFLEAVYSRLKSPLETDDASALSPNYQWIFRNVDNVIGPTRGTTLSLQTALGHTYSTTSDSGPFARGYARLTWYQPVGDWFTTVRVEAAEVFARASVGVPDTLLFRAGGSDSVRGYAYRDLGPKVDGTVTSGRVLGTASLEVARPLTQRYPDFLGAVFVDAGNAADHWSDLHPELGYGVGVHWRSPVGQLRVDLAYGQEVQQFRVHLSLGVAF